MSDEDAPVETTDENGVVINYYTSAENHQSFVHGMCIGIFVMGIASSIMVWFLA